MTIITEGSATLGTGHLRRSATLARELARHTPVQIWVLGRETRNECAPQIGDWFSGLAWNAGPEPSVPSVEAVILDLEQASHRSMQARCANAGLPCLALDYNDPANLPDVTINLIDHSGAMREAYSAAGRPENYREGADYALIRPEITNRRFSLPLADEVQRVVVTMGGADPAARTLAAVEMLRGEARQPRQVTIVLGPLVPDNLESAVRSAATENMAVLRCPTGFDDLLAEADVILTSGGTTLLEALCLPKPAAVFPQNAAERAHAAIYIEKRACVPAESLPQLLTDRTMRFALAESAARAVDGRGVERVVQAALELAARPKHS